jgi:hypothetical protein
MITRRDGLIGALSMIAGAAAPCRCHAQPSAGLSPRGRESVRGCMLDDHEAEQLLAGSAEAVFFPGSEPLVLKSGDPDFDYALAQTLSRLADTFEVLPGFTFYRDDAAPNARATAIKRMARADGTIFFGLQYLKRLLARPESPDAVVAEVCAHEFAHIAQYKHGLRDALLAGQSTSRRLELHADFLAGYFAGVRKLERSDYPAAVFAAAAYAAGDYNVGRKSHHGTPDERAAAVVRGFEAACHERQAFPDAIRAGVTYVSAL